MPSWLWSLEPLLKAIKKLAPLHGAPECLRKLYILDIQGCSFRSCFLAPRLRTSLPSSRAGRTIVPILSALDIAVGGVFSEGENKSQVRFRGTSLASGGPSGSR